MKYILVAIWIIIVNGSPVLAQTYWVKKTPLFDFLYHSNRPIPNITSTGGQNFLHIPNGHKYWSDSHILVKSNHTLFILVKNTGQVYEAKKETNDSIAFTRIDSTYVEGYNGTAINFSLNDTIFSFGGYGIWRRNSDLRYFSRNQKEWDLLPVSEEFPTQEFIYLLDTERPKLYYIQEPYCNETTGKVFNNYSLIELDLTSKKNTNKGEISKQLSDVFKSSPIIYSINIKSLNGNLVYYNKQNVFFISYENNTVSRLVNPLIIDILSGNSIGALLMNIFEYDHKIYCTLSNDSTNQLHSFPISMSDFKIESYPLFEPVYDTNSPRVIMLSMFSLLILSSSVLIIRKRKNKISAIPVVTINQNEVVGDNGRLSFSELENELVTKIIHKSNQAHNITVDEVNLILGLGKKSLEVQRKFRTETINRINHKFKVLFESEDNLIERLRFEEDRRYYKYTINDANAKTYLGQNHI